MTVNMIKGNILWRLCRINKLNARLKRKDVTQKEVIEIKEEIEYRRKQIEDFRELLYFID